MANTTGTFRILNDRLFGLFSRYKLTEAIDRFGDPVFIVTDAHILDPDTDLPATIRIERTRDAAMRGLDDEDDDFDIFAD